MVGVSDGRARLHLLRSEFEMTSAAFLRWMLARQPGSETVRTAAAS
jgi:hypothetical protein